MIRYEDLYLRNAGYIPPELQDRIRRTRLLIAGCGLGSTIAEAAARIGFERFVLADGDSVVVHNLNRQAFAASDIGRQKVAALADRIRAINPGAEVIEFDGLVRVGNAPDLVGRSDFVVDTIDFLDLPGVVSLHDECLRQKRPAISAMTAGWGAVAVYFPVGGECTFRRLFGLPESGSVENRSYVEHFFRVVQRLKGALMPEVVAVLEKAFTDFKDGTPCPASQVAPGAASVAALAITATVRALAGLPITSAPRMIVADMSSACTAPGIDILA